MTTPPSTFDDLIMETAREGRVLVVIYRGNTLIFNKSEASELMARLPGIISEMKGEAELPKENLPTQPQP